MDLRSENPPTARPRPKLRTLAGVNQAIQEEFALRRAARSGRRTVIDVAGHPVAVIPLSDLRRLEWFLEQEKEEDEIFDRIDIEEAERRLEDPNDATIPYEQVRRELGLADLSD